MIGHRLIFDRSEVKYANKIFIKRAKESFLYDSKGNKYFDFSSTLESNIFGYSNKYLTSQIKRAFSKTNHYIHSSKQALSYLTPLYHHYPIFNHYHCYPLSFDLLNQWIGENDHCIQRESIEENLYRSFELKRENSIGEKDHRTKINWISDLAFLFDKREMGEEEQGRERGLILNSCFPHFLEALSLDQFNYLLCYGNHPFGMGNYFLLWSKLPLPIESSLQSFPLFLYKEGIKKALFRIQKSKILRECLNKLREELSIIKYLDRVSNVEGRDFFYKITLKNSIPPTSTSRIFVENASFLTDKKKILYLSLPLYLQLNHLKGKLTKAFTTLSHFIEDK